MQFLTHFNGFLILARNLFAGGFGCKTIVLKGAFYGWGDAIFNPFQWVFDTSPQFIRGRVRMQTIVLKGLQNDRRLARS